MNSLDLNDLPFLKEESLRVYRWLLAKFPELDTLETNESLQFPLRWMTEQKGQRFEWVVSDMGSVTLRLGGLEGNRRNPAPIFYLSLRKLEADVFHWTDPEGNPVPFPDPSILIDIQNRIQLYLDSVS
ncbi:LIC_13241 domain-containing protein [Leptospira kanakyensis]|uniref:LIC_13241 domain-containing protein n=1 Tax=Leptospira kanakyensis TaxID=2484968 RepID=UPI00223CDC5A|nr:hypothetical protein [Leptospira kanakyensis]MCW7469803.1 hypothetical protein [Leptospira kanakyensis]MCW7480784.1 hypothetical protein [Leptospira kanakyensis]